MSLDLLDVRARQAADEIRASVAKFTTTTFADVTERRGPRPGSFEQLLLIRDSRARTKRLVAAVVAMVVAVAAIGGLISMYRSSQHRRPAITPKNISRLKLTGAADLNGQPSMLEPDTFGVQGRGRIVFRPVVADGHVFVATSEGVSAYPRGCGTASFPCSPDWIGRTSGAVLFPPVVADGNVIVGTADGHLVAFPTSCGSGGSRCRPAWVGATQGRPWAAPVVADHMVYLHTLPGGVVAFATTCGQDGATCSAAWTQHPDDPATRLDINRLPLHNNLRSVPHPLAVAGGVVYAVGTELPGTPDNFKAIYRAGGPRQELFAYDARTGRLLWSFRRKPHVCCDIYHDFPTVSNGVVYARLGGLLFAFPTSCADTGPACAPLWRAHTPGGPMSSPVVAGGRVFVGTANRSIGPNYLYAFPTECGTTGGSCEPAWRADTDEVVMLNPVIHDDIVYAPSVYGERLTAFDPHCVPQGDACQPLWTSSRIRGQEFPVVTDGVVYVGSYLGRLYAFDANCRTGNDPCAPLWTWRAHGFLSTPTVDDGVLYVASGDGKLYTFSIPGG